MLKCRSIFRLALLCFATTALFGCENMLEPSSPWKRGTPEARTFSDAHYLCEVKTLLPDNGEGVYVANESGTCSPWAHYRLPTFAEFYHNPNYWQSWHDNFGTKYRILGVLEKNTAYHPTRIIIKGKSRIEYITIDSGPLAGTQAELRR